MKHINISSAVLGVAMTASILALPFAAFAQEHGKGPNQQKPVAVHIDNKVKVDKVNKITPGDLHNGKLGGQNLPQWMAFFESWFTRYHAQGSTTPPVVHPTPSTNDRDNDGDDDSRATSTPHGGPVVGPNASTTPVISNITAALGSETIRLAWNSGSLSDSAVFYSTSSPVVIGATSTLVVSNANLVAHHTINVTSLTTSTSYYFLVQSKNQVGTTTSGQFSLTTLNM